MYKYSNILPPVISLHSRKLPNQLNMLKQLAIFCFVALASATAYNWDSNWWRNTNWSEGHCHNNYYVQNFQPEKFFNGYWYGKYVYNNYYFQYPGTCSYLHYLAHGDYVDYGFYEYSPKSQSYQYYKGSFQRYNLDRATYYVHYDELFGLKNVYVPYTVVATDYDHYAFLYSCQEFFGYKLEFAYAVTRERDTSSYDSYFRRAAGELGLDYQHFEPVTNHACPAYHDV